MQTRSCISGGFIDENVYGNFRGKRKIMVRRVSSCQSTFFDGFSTFSINFRQTHTSIVLIERLCGRFNDMFQLLGIDIYDQDVMTDEIEEDLSEMSFAQDET